MRKIYYRLILLFMLIVTPIVFIGCANNDSRVYVSSLTVIATGRLSGYDAFDSLDCEGLVLKATYSNGLVVDITSGYSISYCFKDNPNQPYHTDYFYAGETKVKITFGEAYCFLTVDEVAKINRSYTIELEEYSQIYNGNRIEIPKENVVIKNSQGQVVNKNFKLVYCSTFNDYYNNLKTTTNHGAIVQGGAPSHVGEYKVYAMIEGNDNFNNLYSNVVEFNIIDESNIDLCAKENEKFFGFKEASQIAKLDPYYIQFEVQSENNNKKLKYHSTFAGDGEAMIFSDHITLIGENEKTQIRLENDKIYFQNSEKILNKWITPSYLGTYQKTITPEDASQFGIIFNEDEICKIEIFIDEDKKDGKVHFKFDLWWKLTDEICNNEIIEGYVFYSEDQAGTGNLAFNRIDGDRIINLFSINEISNSHQLTSFIINMAAEQAQISNGQYTRI